jgi:hypothetical protein
MGPYLINYDFGIVHRAYKVNWDVNGLSRNPNYSENDITKVRCHGDVDLEVVIGWHPFSYLCTLLGCSRDAPHINMSTKDFRGVDIEPKGHNALNIHDDAPIITYL